MDKPLLRQWLPPLPIPLRQARIAERLGASKAMVNRLLQGLGSARRRGIGADPPLTLGERLLV